MRRRAPHSDAGAPTFASALILKLINDPSFPKPEKRG
jgi:hypothetical protein